jgi:hypothetical protein
MLMFRERRPAIRTLRGRAISVLQEVGPSASARSTARCWTAPIRMLASAPSILLAGIRRSASLRKLPPSLSWKSWAASAIPVPNAFEKLDCDAYSA